MVCVPVLFRRISQRPPPLPCPFFIQGPTFTPRTSTSINAQPLPPLGADIHAKDKHGKTLLQFPKDDKVFRFLYDIDRAEQMRPSATYPRPQGVSACVPATRG